MGYPSLADIIKSYDETKQMLTDTQKKLEGGKSEQEYNINFINNLFSESIASIENFVRLEVEERKTYDMNDYITKEGFRCITDNYKCTHTFSFPFEFLFGKEELEAARKSIVVYYILKNDTPSTHTIQQDIKQQFLDKDDELSIIMHPPLNYLNKFFIYDDYDKIIGNIIYKDLLTKIFKEVQEGEKSKSHIKQIINRDYDTNKIIKYTWTIDNVRYSVDESDFKQIDRKLLPDKVEKKTYTVYSWTDNTYATHTILSVPQTKSILNEIAEIVNL